MNAWQERRRNGTTTINTTQGPFPTRKLCLALHVKTVATQIHKYCLHRLIPPGFMIAAKIILFSSQCRPIFNIFSLLVSLNPLPDQYLRKMVAGPEAETSGSKLWQAGKEKRKGEGVSNSTNYGITIPRRPYSKVQSLPKAIQVHMVISTARSTEVSPAQLCCNINILLYWPYRSNATVLCAYELERA